MLSFTCSVHNNVLKSICIFDIITYMYIVLIRLFHHKVLYFVFLTHICEQVIFGPHFTFGKGMA